MGINMNNKTVKQTINQIFNTHGMCQKESIVEGENYRFTVLTECLIRMEYSDSGKFEDLPSTFAINRDFDVPHFKVLDQKEYLEIHTDKLSIYYDRKPFSPGGLFVKVRSESKGIYCIWHFDDALLENLGGTARTLDQADGAIELERGVQSRLQGYSVIDDSDSILLTNDNWIASREEGTKDIYFFGYGLTYKECIRNYFKLSGKTPLLPRFVFGNWWSRFYPYSSEEYISLMEDFQKEAVPLSVAVIDMDWHITEVEAEYGKGWTGYTWNDALIPKPTEFLQLLHDKKMKVTLNLHPADGIQAHERLYQNAAKELDRNPEYRLPIPFDFCNPKFVRTYFETLLHPLEKDGVDFWWIDWQQGKNARIQGADPLWLLNHFHFLESAVNQKRPFIFSRYAGPGSHRYPIGFSGDTIISWKSLAFQPYFTATAANIGFGWWSHDIGGHCGGKKDDDLMVRWVQWGVFSPVMRLHSTSNLFNGKEPWNFSEPARSILKYYLRLRHRMIPYLYTQNWRTAKEDELLVYPMYYEYPKAEEAYEVPNQYLFGNQFMVCPITEPLIPALALGKTGGWLPEGVFYDFFNGLRYSGNRKLELYRTMEEIPVFVRAGAIIPMTEEKEAITNGVSLPKCMEITIFGGDDGTFCLYEDDGESMEYLAGHCAFTEYHFYWRDKNGNTSFMIVPDDDKKGIRPQKRKYILHFAGVKEANAVKIFTETGEKIKSVRYYDVHRREMIVTLSEVSGNHKIEVSLTGGLTLIENNVQERIYQMLNRFQIEYEKKEQIYNCIKKHTKRENAVVELRAMNLDYDLYGAILEVLLAE